MEKLRKIQAELKAPKNQFNSFGKYKYRNCEDILEAVKPLLLKHACTLTLNDMFCELNGISYINAEAIFSDGSETIQVSAQAGVDINRKGMDIAQSFGSSSSYARKYALNGLFLIDDTKDADAQEPVIKPQEKRKPAKPGITNIALEKLKAKIIEGESDVITNAKKAFTLKQPQLDELEDLQRQFDLGL